MPKKVGFLYEKMLDKELIRQAIMTGAADKHRRWDVVEVMDDIEAHVDMIYTMLETGGFVPAKPRTKKIYDSSSRKHRTIHYTPLFPDGIIQHLVVMAAKQVIMRGMHHWSCACIPGRGSAHAIKKVKSIVKRDPKGTKYVLKFDIKQYYPSINHKKLIWALARKIKDKRFLKLVYDIITSCDRGLAIGFFVNQWLANYYLEPLDHYIMSLPGVSYMLRYMDDFVIFGANKKLLHKARRLIDAFMRDVLDLEMKRNWQVFPLKSRAVDFVGFKFHCSHTTLRRRNFLKFARQCRRVRKKQERGIMPSYKMCAGLLSRAGQLRHCDSHMIRAKYLDPIKVKTLKEVVRYESKRRCAAQQRVHAGKAA